MAQFIEGVFAIVFRAISVESGARKVTLNISGEGEPAGIKVWYSFQLDEAQKSRLSQALHVQYVKLTGDAQASLGILAEFHSASGRYYYQRMVVSGAHLVSNEVFVP